MQNWMIAIVPPLLVWFGLFLYLIKVERQVSRIEKKDS
jgi:hypothetical protein